MAFDRETDVLVVGTGGAAFSAAITARKYGARVIMLEKAPTVGGTTARSGGGFWVPNNHFLRKQGVSDTKEDALRYMARYSYPHLYNPEAPRLGLPENEFALIEAFYDNASKMAEFLRDCGAVKSVQETNWLGKNPVDYMDHLPENKGIRGRVLYPQDDKGNQAWGPELIRQMKAWVDANDIAILTDHQAAKILKNDKGEVIGLEVKTAGGESRKFGARKAVIFGSGGYTHDPDLMLHFQRGPHFGGCAAPSNTGDFVKMAGAIGAKLGNMAGAFRSELVLEGALHNPQGIHNVFFVRGDSVIEVNKRGLRIMDEKRNYSDRAMVHFVWDPQNAEWTNMLVFMVFDQRTATLWQGFPPYPAPGWTSPYVIAGNTLDDLAGAIEARLKALSPMTGGFSLAPGFADNLKKTVARFNGFAESGKDEDFGRGDFTYDREWTSAPPTIQGKEWPDPRYPNLTMHPLSGEGPYHAVILGAGTLDTNGGPVVNPKSQVLDVESNPIPGLYGAGNCIAAPSANAYWGAGGTLGPALTFGYIAGINAAKEADKKE